MRPVTFLIGENGSGTSTFREALAVTARAASLDSYDLSDDATLAGARRLAGTLTVVTGKRSATRLFFFGRKTCSILRDAWNAMRASYAAWRTIYAARYGDDPHARSHGETFLEILRQRIVPRGSYFFDEPQTPLSPMRVLALLALVYDAARAGLPFIIATHSPILAALTLGYGRCGP